MKRSILLFILFFYCFTGSFASHIVGGELELAHIRGEQYRLRLNLYNDNKNGNPLAIDDNAFVTIYRKSDNMLMGTYTLPKSSTNQVPYTNIECTDANLSTSRIMYELTITLLAQNYNHPQGYYAVWERCCRNGVIQNITSPGETGTVFYLEFPPVIQNGSAFRNSSPQLFPPLSDYACLNKPFAFDFSGNDADGDSLVYSLSVPLRGATEADNRCCPQSATPAPHRLVAWAPGYSNTLQIMGSPSLNINPQTGFLSVTPDRTGLFVFSVKCEEYRNGTKIGEVRRDFQLFVVDCPQNDPPAISMLNPETGNLYTEGDTLFLSRTDDLCLKFKITDPDSDEKLTVQAIPLNFTPGGPLLSEGSNTVIGIVNSSTNPSDSLQYELCLEPCLTQNGEAYRITLAGRDNACSVPQRSRLNLIVIVEPDPNAPPVAEVARQNDTITVRVGEQLVLPARASDPDQDVLKLTAVGNGFALAAKGMSFPEQVGVAEVSGDFTWTVPCNAYTDEILRVDFVAADENCGLANTDTVTVWFRVEHSDLPAAISTDLPGSEVYRVQVQAGQSVNFNLFGNDQDTTRMQLSARGLNFDMADYPMQFTGSSGTRTITSPFIFTPPCEFNELPELAVEFILSEFACPETRIETIQVIFEIIDTVRKDVEPFNVITPNGDGKNEYFSLDGLPLYDCMGDFDFVEIYNRWGNLVFRERTIDFKWDASPFAIGSYYYFIKFENRSFKGWVTVLK
jgi:gliding motility-associated-like protein